MKTKFLPWSTIHTFDSSTLCCTERKQHDKRMPGLFNVEWQWASAARRTSAKVSAKDILDWTRTVISMFWRHRRMDTTQTMSSVGPWHWTECTPTLGTERISLFYPKRIVAADGVSMAPTLLYKSCCNKQNSPFQGNPSSQKIRMIPIPHIQLNIEKIHVWWDPKQLTHHLYFITILKFLVVILTTVLTFYVITLAYIFILKWKYNTFM